MLILSKKKLSIVRLLSLVPWHERKIQSGNNTALMAKNTEREKHSEDNTAPRAKITERKNIAKITERNDRAKITERKERR